MVSDANESENVNADAEVPPYSGRRESADVRGKDAAVNDSAKVGGATGPVENDEMAADDPDTTPGGATGRPADEQPARQTAKTRDSDEGVGPAHEPGTGRAEDQV
jgi:hypothetical protein